MTADTTVLLDRVRGGDGQALDTLVEQLYDELRAVAHRQRVHVGARDTVNTTAVVHEAYAKLAGRNHALDLADRDHFVQVAARAMRDVVVDYARAQAAAKRGGAGRPATLDAALGPVADRLDLDEALSVDAALDQLAALDPDAARIAELRYFAGLSNQETAQALDVSVTTVKRRWNVGRAWLARHLADDR